MSGSLPYKADLLRLVGFFHAILRRTKQWLQHEKDMTRVEQSLEIG
jgi:hypothetical protein